MYSIEINLLKDRPEYSQETATYSGGGNGDDKTPLLLGVAFGGAVLGLMLVSLGVLSFLNQRLAAERDELDAELQALAPRVKEVEEIQKNTDALTTETKALATIFNQIKPWSAMLQDLADRVPTELQITKITQSDPTAANANRRGAPPAPAQPAAGAGAPAAPVNNETIEIVGKSLSFGHVNDFELTLRQSPFLLGEQTRLITSEREQERQLQRGGSQVRQVDFTVNTKVNSIPADELLQVLNSKGASGLVSRINTLKEKGVIQP